MVGAVAEEVGRRPLLADGVVGQRVEVRRGDVGCDGGAQGLQRAGDHETGLAHDRDLVGRLDLDARAEQAHGLGLERPRRGRCLEGPVDALGDLVDVTHAVDLAELTALAVDLQQRCRLGGVDLLPVTDHLFGVVGAATGLRALEQAAARPATSCSAPPSACGTPRCSSR